MNSDVETLYQILYDAQEVIKLKHFYMFKKVKPSLVSVLCLAMLMSSVVQLPAAGASVNFKTYLTGPQVSRQVMPDTYAPVMQGVTTFRGNALRSAPAFGKATVRKQQLRKLWAVRTGSSSWGGGAGWTGQPAIVRWSEESKRVMNISAPFKQKPNFTEVIYGSLDGRIYFLDLDSGKQTRKPIVIRNPIKGSLSVDPRGYPILYIGQGINETGEFRFRMFSLIDGKLLSSINGIDKQANRRWGAFDGSALINRETDTMYLGGENGILYRVKLNTRYNAKRAQLSLNPKIDKYVYQTRHQGIENSVAMYKNLAYFSDNGGFIQAVDMNTLTPRWTFKGNDDTDATIAIEVENGIPFLYTGNQVDKQGPGGKVYLRKLNGLTGKVVWQQAYPCYFSGGSKPVNGGLLASPVIGKGDIKDRVIFTLARYGTMKGGLMVALNKQTGKPIWEQKMRQYAWSSPVDVIDQTGKSWLFQADSVGQVLLVNPTNGSIRHRISYGANIEASPAVFNGVAVTATRAGQLIAFRLE